MGTMPKKKDALVRVVGRRPFAESDIDNPDTSYDFGPDGEIVVEETIEISVEDAAAKAAAIEKRRSHAETLVDELTPAAYAIHLAMHAALRSHADTLEARFASDPPHLLVAVRVPSDDWYIPASKAFAAVVAGIVADRLSVPAKTTAASPESDRALGNGYQLSPYAILRHVKNDHVLAVYCREDHMPAELIPFCDVVLDMNPIAPRHFELAIQREFDEPGEAGWSPWICQADLDPQLLDSVCSRAGRVGDVVPMLRTVLDARVVAKKKAEADGEKQTSTSKKIAVDVLRPTEPRLETLHGYGAFGAWGLQLAEDLASYDAGDIGWEDVDAAALVYGPPGTGKTLVARAVAATCGVAFIPTSFATWMGVRGGYLGDVTNAIRSFFAAAAEAAPCVMFIDEIDSLPSRGRSRDHDDYWRVIVNALLESMDGTARREGVIVIAACNDPSGLDPALVRSGRLDRRFEIGLPNETDLLHIMLHHLPDADAADLAPAATVLAGSASGADVSRIARDARRTARRENRGVTAQDLLAVAIPADTLSARDRRLVAVHEAGHAVATMVTGRMPDALSIVTADGAHGGVRIEPNLGMGRLGDFEHEVIARLAGRAAEEVVLGEPSAGAETDLQVATSLVVRVHGTTGLGGRLTHGEKPDGNVVEARMGDLYARALRLVGEHRAAVERLADLAIEHRVLGRAALVEFAREHGFGGSI